MPWIITKYLLTAGIIVLVSEIAKRYERLGGLIAALPLMTVIGLIWLYIDKQPTDKIANHAWYTFWYVIPTLPMFLFFPYILPKIGFWPSLISSILITILSFLCFAAIIRRFGINLI